MCTAALLLPHLSHALVRCGDIKVSISYSRVTFARLTRGQIDTYTGTGEPFDKAGAYGIQGFTGTMISHLSGSYSGVMGLPVHETAPFAAAHD